MALCFLIAQNGRRFRSHLPSKKEEAEVPFVTREEKSALPSPLSPLSTAPRSSSSPPRLRALCQGDRLDSRGCFPWASFLFNFLRVILRVTISCSSAPSSGEDARLLPGTEPGLGGSPRSGCSPAGGLWTIDLVFLGLLALLWTMGVGPGRWLSVLSEVRRWL